MQQYSHNGIISCFELVVIVLKGGKTIIFTRETVTNRPWFVLQTRQVIPVDSGFACSVVGSYTDFCSLFAYFCCAPFPYL